MTILYSDSTIKSVTEFIDKRAFSNLDNKKVLELGPQDGAFTEKILNHANHLTCIEFDKRFCEILLEKFGDRINIVFDDFHECLKNIGQFDAVVIYGVLYHSPAPFYLLEKIVNHINPHTILIETWSPAVVEIVEENPNVSGMRQSIHCTSNMVFNIPKNFYIKAIQNLGYTLVDEFLINDYIDETKTLDFFKHNGNYLTFTKEL